MYGSDRTAMIPGLCANKTFLRLSELRSAEWASKCLGDTETKATFGKYTVTPPLFAPGEFLKLKTPQWFPGSRMQGIHHIPDIGAPFSTDEEARAIFGMNFKPTDEQRKTFLDHVDRPNTDQNLKPWTSAEELDFLGPAR